MTDPTLRHVFIRDMVLQASIGWYPHEHGAPQRVRINVDLSVTEHPDPDDTLDRVVSYETIAQSIRAITTAGHIKLVETLAERIATACLEDPRIRQARIQVEKLDVFPDAASAGIAITRNAPTP